MTLSSYICLRLFERHGKTFIYERDHKLRALLPK